MLEPSVRARLDAATHEAFVTVHAESVAEAISAARAHAACGLLLSPSFLGNESLESIDRLVGKSLAMLTVAIVAEQPTTAAKGLLELGACGVRRAIDLSKKEGWDALRNLVDHGGGDTAARILDEIGPLIQTATPELQQFFRALIRGAPHWGTVRTLAATLRIGSSTLNSRFFRAGLPLPKRLLASTRLLYAAAFFESPGASIADVANALEYSSPQSFNRHVQAMWGLTAGEFRRAYSFVAALEDYKRTLVMPYESTFRSFKPIRLVHRPSGSAPRLSVRTTRSADPRSEPKLIAV
jgi:AraC-like DNA-binding protein